MKPDREMGEMEKWRGRGFTLNGWDRAERAGGEGQTEMLEEERQMEEDG